MKSAYKRPAPEMSPTDVIMAISLFNPEENIFLMVDK
jgi:hypothetical protein